MSLENDKVPRITTFADPIRVKCRSGQASALPLRSTKLKAPTIVLYPRTEWSSLSVIVVSKATSMGWEGNEKNEKKKKRLSKNVKCTNLVGQRQRIAQCLVSFVRIDEIFYQVKNHDEKKKNNLRPYQKTMTNEFFSYDDYICIQIFLFFYFLINHICPGRDHRYKVGPELVKVKLIFYI